MVAPTVVLDSNQAQARKPLAHHNPALQVNNLQLRMQHHQQMVVPIVLLEHNHSQGSKLIAQLRNVQPGSSLTKLQPLLVQMDVLTVEQGIGLEQDRKLPALTRNAHLANTQL